MEQRPWTSQSHRHGQKMRPWYWPLDKSKYGQIRRSKGANAMDIEEYELGRMCRPSDSSRSSTSLTTKFTSCCLPRGLDRRFQREKDQQREWVIGVLISAFSASTILFLNIVLTVIAVSLSYPKFRSRDFSSAVLYRGNCAISENWARGLHLLINILGTIMLAASNYCMQCLSSPSRQNVDNAHAQRKWLNIGVSSIKNLRFVGRRRLTLWMGLLVSSLPIHLLYNSTVFSALGTREYGVLLASANFDFSNPPDHSLGYAGCFEQNIAMNMSTFYSEVSKYEKLETYKCIDTYAADYIADRGTLILVTNNMTADNQSLRWVTMGNSPQRYSSYSFKWMCQSEPSYPQFIHDDIPGEKNCEKFPCQKECKRGDCETACLGDWSVSSMPWSDPLLTSNVSHRENISWVKDTGIQRTEAACALDSVSAGSLPALSVDYCLSQKVEEECQLLFSLPICIIVILCNIIKVVCMFMTAHDGRKEIFLTVGDAISSFLSRPDSTTEGQCLLSKENFSMREHSWKRPLKPVKLRPGKRRWKDAVSGSYYAVTVAFCLLLLLLSVFLFYLGAKTLRAKGQPIKPTDLWRLGFGNIVSSAILKLCDNPSNCSGTIPIALLANIPQIIISSAYFLYNNMLTIMLLAAEYNDYAIERKPLRVSWAKGLQRSTYYLSLPYRYSIPLMISNTILHWLVSQSFFFVEVVLYDMAGNLTTERLIACGYSPIALAFAIILGFVMLCTILGLGLKRFETNMPLAVSCSAAISAACHPPPGDDHALKPLMWGEIPTPQIIVTETDSQHDGKVTNITVSLSDTISQCSDEEGLQGRANESQIQLLGESKNNVAEDDEQTIDTVSLDTRSHGSDEEDSNTDQGQGNKSHVHLLGGSNGAGEEDCTEYGHCSFSSLEVITPSTERLYL